MGAEFKKKGVSVALGPVVGPLGKIAKGGRNWEGFSNDPYLSGELVFETVQVLMLFCDGLSTELMEFRRL